MIPRVKICCIGSVAEARLAISYGAHAVGLVSAMPSGPGVISESLIEQISPAIPPGVASFLLTCRQSAEAIIDQQRRLGVNTIQLCDSIPIDEYPRLRGDMPGVKLVQVIHVLGIESIKAAVQVAPLVDGLLLDSGNPTLAVKELGGTGRRHDWAVSRRICESVEIPVFLAGGLRPDNVAEAIETVRPFGVDVCSGVRTNGDLDEAKLAAFIQAVYSR